MVGRGLEVDHIYFIPQIKQLGIFENDFADWVPCELLQTIRPSYPPAILSWVRIWGRVDEPLPTTLQAHDLTTDDGICEAFNELVETAARLDSDLILFDCPLIDAGTVAAFR